MGDNTFYYSGKASTSGHGLTAEEVFRSRYKQGFAGDEWKEIPGTNMQIRVRVPQANVKCSNVFTGTGEGSDLVVINGKQYGVEELAARSVERENYRKHLVDGRSLNAYNPVRDEEMDLVIDFMAPKIGKCWRNGLY